MNNRMMTFCTEQHMRLWFEPHLLSSDKGTLIFFDDAKASLCAHNMYIYIAHFYFILIYNGLQSHVLYDRFALMVFYLRFFIFSRVVLFITCVFSILIFSILCETITLFLRDGGRNVESTHVLF